MVIPAAILSNALPRKGAAFGAVSRNAFAAAEAIPYGVTLLGLVSFKPIEAKLPVAVPPSPS